MLGKTHLVNMEHNISIAKEGGNGHRPGVTWGGANVILCVDLHQFPPVAQGKKKFLFYPGRLGDENQTIAAGRRLYEEFSMVVILNQQMRVTDPVWRDMLVHLRQGEVQAHHLQMLRQLILRPVQTEDALNFDYPPWSKASLVTPRHAVRNLWNEYAVRKWCASSGNQLYVIVAEDRISTSCNQPAELMLAKQYAVACQSKTESWRQRQAR